MSALDDLPADQRAVLELVLARGRNYDQIAAMLGLDRAAVRQRALDAMDNLAPNAGVPAERRALVTDYLVGQLPPRVAQQVRDRLAEEPPEREWANALAAELASLAEGPLPELPSGDEAVAVSAPQTPVSVATEAEAPAQAVAGAPPREPAPGPTPPRRSSRAGGVILLVIGVLVVIAVVLVLVLSGGSPKKKTSSGPVAATTQRAGATTSTSSSTASPKILANVTLSPVTAASKAKGEAAAFSQSGGLFLAIVAVNLSPNSTATASRNYYAVWLSNSPTDSRFLGFAPIVTSNGQLRAATQLRSTDNHYKKLLLTLETKQSPKTPGTVVLSGAFSLK